MQSLTGQNFSQVDDGDHPNLVLNTCQLSVKFFNVNISFNDPVEPVENCRQLRALFYVYLNLSFIKGVLLNHPYRTKQQTDAVRDCQVRARSQVGWDQTRAEKKVSVGFFIRQKLTSLVVILLLRVVGSYFLKYWLEQLKYTNIFLKVLQLCAYQSVVGLTCPLVVKQINSFKNATPLPHCIMTSAAFCLKFQRTSFLMNNLWVERSCRNTQFWAWSPNMSNFLLLEIQTRCIGPFQSEENETNWTSYNAVCVVSDSHGRCAHTEGGILGNWQSISRQCQCSLLPQQQAFYHTNKLCARVCVCVCVCSGQIHEIVLNEVSELKKP